MCLRLEGKEQQVLIAEKDIRVYKTLRGMAPLCMMYIHTPEYTCYEYELGKIYKGPAMRVDIYPGRFRYDEWVDPFTDVDVAFHSFKKSRIPNNVEEDINVVEFIIPSGTPYYKNREGYYASQDIKCVRKMRKFLWWWV